MQVFIRTLIITSITLITFASQANHEKLKTVIERTSPVGQVTIIGKESAGKESAGKESVDATETSATAAAEPRDGATIYGSLCIACHSTGLANAPKTGDTVAWAKLMEVGIDALVGSAKKGKNVMPPKGNCTDCSDDELKSAIQFMSEAKN